MSTGTVVIPLTKGYNAIIDAADYPLVAPYAWRAGCMSEHHVYATAYLSRAQTPPDQRIGRGGTNIYLHRLLMNPPKGMVVDHINGDTLDNRRTNLRVTDHAKNAANRHRVTARLEDEDFRLLAALATQMNVTDAGVIREAIRTLARQRKLLS